MEFLAGLHPKAVHYPIALLSIYPVLILINNFYRNETLSKASLLLLAGGVAGVIVALLTGNSAFQEFVEQNKQHPQINMVSELIEVHEDFATGVVVIFGLSFFLQFIYFVKAYIRKDTLSKFFMNMPRILIALTLLGIYFLYKTGEIGGKLVFEYGVGTKNFQVH